MASTYLSRTTVTPTNATKFTFSAWCKISDVEEKKTILGYNGGNHWYVIQFSNSYDNNRFEWVEYNSSATQVVQKYTNASLRDVNGYYHIVCKYDSTQGTATDRTKLYINGEEASLATNNNPAQALSSTINLGGHTQLLGAYESSSNRFNGILSHVHFIDGTAYDASAFGETDSTTGEWKINTSPSVTYGNNGFFVLKDGNSVTDQSGNGNNFTVAGGTLTNTEDCPSNVFATMNPLHYESRNTSFNDGNTTLVSTGSASWTTHYGLSTLAMGSGKYYLEVKVENTGSGAQSYPIGIIAADKNITSSIHDNGVAAVRSDTGNIVGNGSNIQTGLTAISAGDILGAAFDATNGTIQFYRNGSTHGNAVTGIDTTKEYYFGCDTYEGSSQFKFNFGNGTFGSSGISDAGTNASNNGIFEYDVPSGYTALSTKGLNL